MSERLFARLSAQPPNERTLVLSFDSVAEAEAWDKLARTDLAAALRVVMVVEAGGDHDPWNAYIWGPPVKAPPPWTAPSPEDAARRIAALHNDWAPPIASFSSDHPTQPIGLAEA